MKVLFIGGTGTISASCTRLAAKRGVALTLLNRGSSAGNVPDGVEVLRADSHDDASVQQELLSRMTTLGVK